MKRRNFLRSLVALPAALALPAPARAITVSVNGDVLGASIGDAIRKHAGLGVEPPVTLMSIWSAPVGTPFPALADAPSAPWVEL